MTRPRLFSSGKRFTTRSSCMNRSFRVQQLLICSTTKMTAELSERVTRQQRKWKLLKNRTRCSASGSPNTKPFTVRLKKISKPWRKLVIITLQERSPKMKTSSDSSCTSTAQCEAQGRLTRQGCVQQSRLYPSTPLKRLLLARLSEACKANLVLL